MHVEVQYEYCAICKHNYWFSENLFLVIVAFVQNAIIEYSSESLCNRSSNMKFDFVVVYENISDKFDKGHCRTKVKVMVKL